MTDDEKVKIRALKADAAKELQGHDHAWYEERYAPVFFDERIRRYVFEVADHPDRHNVYEILQLRRFFRLADKYSFDPQKAKHFILYAETCSIAGQNGRQKCVLTPIQCFIFANIYGLRAADGRRLTRNVYIFVPRKFGKTEIAAIMATYDFRFGDSNAQAFIASNSYDQSQLCFGEVKAIMDDPRWKERLRINREKIFPLDRSDNRFIQCLSANPKTKDGLNASLVVIDEYAQARDTKGRSGADLKNTLTSSMLMRREPLTVVITTASDVLEGPFVQELEGVKKVLRGESEDDSIYAAIFQPDADDDEGDPATWAKVQPHMGITVQPDAYEHEWRHAQLSAEDMMVFRTKLLNVFAVNESKPWLDAGIIRDTAVKFGLDDLNGRPDGMCAVDLSERRDMSAVTIGIYRYDSKSFYFKTRYYLPEGGVSGSPNEMLYRRWASDGHLVIQPGDVIDYRSIVDDIIAANEKVRILRIGYDPWKSTEMINMLGAAGAGNVLEPVKQTYGYFTAPCEAFEHGIRTGKVHLDDNPINAWCFGNAVLDYDKLDNCKPVKRFQNGKIDGVITPLMCMRLFIDYTR